MLKHKKPIELLAEDDDQQGLKQLHCDESVVGYLDELVIWLTHQSEDTRDWVDDADEHEVEKFKGVGLINLLLNSILTELKQ